MGKTIEYINKNGDFFQFVGTIVTLVLTLIIFFLGYRIQKFLVFKEFRDPLLHFSNECLDAISEIEGLCEVEPEKKDSFYSKRSELINKISSLRDRGKFLMPNSDPESFGANKKEAYKGVRDASLDCLKTIFYLAVAISYENKRENKCKRNIGRLHQIGIKNLKSKNLKFTKHKNIIIGLSIYEALSSLPLKWSIDGPNSEKQEMNKEYGWSIKEGIIEAKRQFTSLMFIKLNPREWFHNIKKLAKK